MELLSFEEYMLQPALELRQQIWDALEDKSWFAAADKEDFLRVLHHGFGLVCMEAGELAACLFCILEGGEYGEDCGYDPSVIITCADYEDVFVKEKYRGNGYQNLLEKEMERICVTKGKQRILGTVSPDNFYSRRNFIKAGYEEVKRIKKYGNLDRIVMEKRLG